MARIVALACLLALLVAACGGDESTAPAAEPPPTDRTEVVHWSPFDHDGELESSFDVQELGNGECLGGSLTIGKAGYRCKAGRWVLDPCWRNGDGVVCAGFPWDTTLSSIRVPASKFPGPSRPRTQSEPWAIELADGHRCRILQSSHVTVRVGGRALATAYDCDGGLVLLRDLTRSKVWRIPTAKWDHGRYTVDPAAAVRRAYFG